MEHRDRDTPPPGLPALDEDAPLDEGYAQDAHYGHNQDFATLRDPAEHGDNPPGEPGEAHPALHTGALKRPRRHGLPLAAPGAAGIPDDDGHEDTGFGDADRS
ncbi:hypothetical protein [Sinomonas halotolerans]|uniref:Uncharacterized protein n=1 Tax=Sinomonas halotolerans TaxID=1644133 RepID=A0ABU9X1Y1_9MICC